MPNPFSLKAILIAASVALLVGLGAGGYVAHAFYAPRLELERGKVSQLGLRVEEQNDSILELKRQEETRARNAKAEIDAARAVADQALADADALMKLVLPLGSDPCKAASSLISKELAK